MIKIKKSMLFFISFTMCYLVLNTAHANNLSMNKNLNDTISAGEPEFAKVTVKYLKENATENVLNLNDNPIANYSTTAEIGSTFKAPIPNNVNLEWSFYQAIPGESIVVNEGYNEILMYYKNSPYIPPANPSPPTDTLNDIEEKIEIIMPDDIKEEIELIISDELKEETVTVEDIPLGDINYDSDKGNPFTDDQGSGVNTNLAILVCLLTAIIILIRIRIREFQK